MTMTERSLETIDTPSLLIDRDRLERNLRRMQEKADRFGVKLRPHTKTHRCPALARRQEELGAAGITVAKLGEAEVMAREGLTDIFIANEIVGPIKLRRLRTLAGTGIRLAVGADNPVHVDILSQAFRDASFRLDVLVDVDTGDPRTGMPPGDGVLDLARRIVRAPGLRFRGIYTHDGQSYDAADSQSVMEIFRESQTQMLRTADRIRDDGIDVEEISVGSTPSLMLADILPGVTEIRPGTYVFMDADQAQVLGTYEHCAQTVLATVISRPTASRVVLDAGTKALTYYVQTEGITRAPGHGRVKANPQLFLDRLSDEHGSFEIPEGFGVDYRIGDRIEIIPNHACPTTNLYDVMYLVSGSRVVDEWPVLCRGKSR